MLPGIITEFANGSLGLLAENTDGVSALVVHGVATADLALQEVVQLRSEPDAVALGLDQTYDETNGCLVHYHIAEFFAENPGGELWLILVDRTTDWQDLVDPTLTTANAMKVMAASEGRVKTIGVAFNPASGYVPVLAGGLDEKVTETIVKAQALVTALRSDNRFVHVVVEGRQFNGTASAADSLRDLLAENVSVVIAQDGSTSFQSWLAGITNTKVLKHAAVGTVLGKKAKLGVSRNIGEMTTDGNLSKNGRWATSYLSSGSALSGYSRTDQGTLNDKGFIFAYKEDDYAGIYFNDDHTCGALTSDYSQWSLCAIMNKAARLVRLALIPFLKRDAPINTTTKRLDKGYIAQMQAAAAGTAGLGQMVDAGEVGSVAVTIEPTQDVLTSKNVDVQYSITPNGQPRTITNKLSFNNPFK